MQLRSPAVARNREPLLAVLTRLLPRRGLVVEIASGSGEHAVFFARHLPELEFLPTDVGAEQLASIDAWRAAEGLPNVLPAQRLDVMDPTWSLPPPVAIFCANLIHIAPPEATRGLLAGAGRTLSPGGKLVTYGPYRVNGEHTAPSNAAFEQWLVAQDPRYGVRDLAEVSSAAREHALELVEQIPMPANNFTLVFEKRGAVPSRLTPARPAGTP